MHCTLLSRFLCVVIALIAATSGDGFSQEMAPTLRVPATSDFAVTGDGSNAAWAKCEWQVMPRRTNTGATTNEGLPYDSKVKALYSPTGVYVLFSATDKKLTVSGLDDFDNLWTEDVFEAFFWPDEQTTTYFEYEISPLGKELPILVPNFDGKFYGWRPWHYEGDRKTKKATAVSGGTKAAGADVNGWTAEVFFPYDLLKPLTNLPPKSGTKWRANFYRVDYDDKKTTRWTWAPVGGSFHEFKRFGTLVFE